MLKHFDKALTTPLGALGLIVLVITLAACAGEQVEPIEPDEPDSTEGEPLPPPEDATPAQPEQGDVIVGEAQVETLTLQLMESFPLQLNAVITGNLPDGCTEIGDTNTSRDGETITVTVETTRPADAVCTEALAPYEETISIDIEGLEAGTYTVNVNGVTETFTLDEDNALGPVPTVDMTNDRPPAGSPDATTGVEVLSVIADLNGNVTVEGTLPNGCTEYLEHEVTKNDTTFNVRLMHNVPPEVSCITVISEYTYQFTLEDLEVGTTYTVIINGDQQAQFTAE